MEYSLSIKLPLFLVSILNLLASDLIYEFVIINIYKGNNGSEILSSTHSYENVAMLDMRILSQRNQTNTVP